MIELLVGGQRYSGWTEARVTRGLERASADFDLAVTEAWPGREQPWVIAPGASARLLVDGEPVIDGWVDSYVPSFGADSHAVRVAGRSRTADLIDCSALVAGGQFRGYDLGQIARALAAPFGVPVRVEADLGAPFPDLQLQQGESCFEVIERLAALRGLLVTDGADGALVITRAGGARAAVRLATGPGGTVLAASATLSDAQRHSDYVVKAQQAGSDQIFGDGAAAVLGGAKDPGVKRYRPLLIVAEAQADGASARDRALWEAKTRAAKATSARITVQGWRQQQGGPLWQPNQRVAVSVPWLGLDRELLVVEVSYMLDDGGTRCELSLSPPEALTPEPPAPGSETGSQGGKAGIWAGLQGIG